MEVFIGITWTIEDGAGVTHAEERYASGAEHDSGGQGRWMDVAVLRAIAAGASIDEIAARLGAGDRAIDQDDVARAIADLERRGLVQAGAEREDVPHVPTERGRRMILDQVGT